MNEKAYPESSLRPRSIKSLLEDGLITQNEFDTKQIGILKRI